MSAYDISCLALYNYPIREKLWRLLKKQQKHDFKKQMLIFKFPGLNLPPLNKKGKKGSVCVCIYIKACSI